MNDEQENKCPECGTGLKTHYEQNGEVGMYTAVSECPGCGYTETEDNG